MYVISLDHYLDFRGAIAIKRGPGRKIADFATAAVAYASNQHRPGDALPPPCFKCRNRKHSGVVIGYGDGPYSLGLSRAGLLLDKPQGRS